LTEIDAMLIVLAQDDTRLLPLARGAAAAHPAIYGAVYMAFQDRIPSLRHDEDLFIVAHGAKDGDDNNPVIGDAREGHYVNAPELYENLQGIFPRGYRGRVFVYACESALAGGGSFSFAEALRNVLQADHGGARVFGRRDHPGPRILTPDAPGWVEATI
jgi:hypothetical protein